MPHLQPQMHFILCLACFFSLRVSPLVRHSLHRGRLECVCNHFRRIFLQQEGSSDSNTKCLQWVGAYAAMQTGKVMDGDFC